MLKHDVREFGAVGDGVTKDTAAIQAALDAGGVACLPPGTYLSGTLYLRSGGGLKILPGAVLLASPDPADYNAADFVPQNSASKAEATTGGHLIAAVECRDIVLCGGGRIDGNFSAFLNEVDPACPVWFRRTVRPAQMIYLCECFGVRVTDLDLVNSPYWSCFLHGCEEVTIRGLHIHTDARVANSDGIDLDCCRRVTVSDCVIETGDDALTLRANGSRLRRKRPCEEIVVSNCILKSLYANAIRLGVGNGEIRNALFNNLIVPGYRCAISIVSNWSNDPANVTGACIHDIEFRNMRLLARRPFCIKLDNNDGEARTAASVRNITFQHIRGTGELSNRLLGNGVGTLSGITFDDVRLTYAGCGPAPDSDEKGAWGHSSSDAVFECRQAEDILFHRVRIDYAPEASGWNCDCRAAGAEVAVENCRFSKGLEQC